MNWTPLGRKVLLVLKVTTLVSLVVIVGFIEHIS